MSRKQIFVISGLIVVALISMAIFIQPAQAEVCGPNNLNQFEEPRRVRFVSLSGKYGQAGVGWVSFVTKNIDPERAVLNIKGLGDYTVLGLSCSCGVQKTCTGYITGLPVGGTAKNYTGKLTVFYAATYKGVFYANKSIASTAPKLQIPPAP